MVVDCPGCALRYQIPARPAGTRARCRCGTHFAIPAEPKTAGALQCPSCGAAADPSKASCNYCSNALAIAACPSCFGMIFSGTRHCPHCGVRADQGARPAESMESVRKCARCDSRPGLVAALTGGVLLDRCEGCGGTFVDRVSLETLITDRDRQVKLQHALSHGDDLVLPVPGVDAVKYLRCPECSVLMQRRNFGRVSGVIVDVCKIHGTWFDAEELRRIVEFVQRGGLDKMRKQEIDALEREIEVKRDRVRQLATQGTGGASYSSSSWDGWGEGAATAVEVAFEVLIRAIF